MLCGQMRIKGPCASWISSPSRAALWAHLGGGVTAAEACWVTFTVGVIGCELKDLQMLKPVWHQWLLSYLSSCLILLARHSVCCRASLLMTWLRRSLIWFAFPQVQLCSLCGLGRSHGHDVYPHIYENKGVEWFFSQGSQPCQRFAGSRHQPSGTLPPFLHHLWMYVWSWQKHLSSGATGRSLVQVCGDPLIIIWW